MGSSIIELLTSASFVYDIGDKVDQHYHDYYQIFYILNGSGYFKYNGETIRANKGDFLFYRPMVTHGLKTVKGQSLQVLDMKFLIKDKEYARCFKKEKVIYSDDLGNAKQIFNIIFKEAKEKRNYYNRIICSCIEQLLYLLLREYSDDVEIIKLIDEKKFEMLGRCTKKTLRFIEGFVVKYIDFTLDDIAEELGYNKDYMCKCFLREVGVSIGHYLTLLRIDKAKELLISTDCDVVEISSVIGYKSASYFIRTFKKIVGECPSTYRKNVKSADSYYKYAFRQATDEDCISYDNEKNYK